MRYGSLRRSKRFYGARLENIRSTFYPLCEKTHTPKGGQNRKRVVRIAGARYPFSIKVLRDRWDKVRTPDLDWHRLRATGITRLIDETGNPKLAQKAAGHASITITLRYYSATDGKVLEAMRAVAAGRKRRRRSGATKKAI